MYTLISTTCPYPYRGCIFTSNNNGVYIHVHIIRQKGIELDMVTEKTARQLTIQESKDTNIWDINSEIIIMYMYIMQVCIYLSINLCFYQGLMLYSTYKTHQIYILICTSCTYTLYMYMNTPIIFTLVLTYTHPFVNIYIHVLVCITCTYTPVSIACT